MSSGIQQTAEAGMQTYFQTCPLPYLILQGEALRLVQANAAAATFFQCSPTVLCATSFFDWIASSDFEKHGLLKKLRSADATPFFLSCKTGSRSTEVQVFQNTISGDVAVLLVPVVQVSDTAENSLLTAMVNETSDVLTAADLEFKPITWSKAAERLYGITEEQALGRNVRNYIEIQYHNSSTEEVRHMARTAGAWKGEMDIVRRSDGRRLTLLITFKLIKDETGAPLHYVISGTDITDRKETEAKLRESENRFREVADSAPVGIWMSEVENKLVYINKPLAHFFGVEPEAFTKDTWVSLIHQDDVHEVLKKFHEHFQQCIPVTLVYRLKQEDGAYHWVQDTGAPRFLSDGTFLGYIGSVTDINDQKQREAQLQYQATLMNNVLDSVVTTDMNFIVQSWNDMAEEIYGYAAADVMGKRQPDMIHFKYIGTTKEEALAELQVNGVWKGEIDIDVRDEERNFLFTVTYITNAAGTRIGIMAIGREITDRKRAEKALQRSESFYRNLFADSVDGKLLTTVEGIITFSSPSIERILGYQAEDVLGRHAFAFVHPDDHAQAWTAFQQEVSETQVVKSVEIRILKRDGSWLWCSVRGHNLLANPHIHSIVISLQDDSQRKQATDALRESEQRFRALVKDVKLGVVLEDEWGTILMYNRATADLFRVAEGVLEKATVYQLFQNAICEDETPFGREAWPMRRAARTKKAVEGVVMGVAVPGGDCVWLLVNSNPVLDESGNIRHIISSFSDITERKKTAQRLMDEQLAQQRLLTQATIDGQERERKEIGKELHDNIGQQLATTKLYLDLAKAGTDTNAEMLDRATRSIMDIINEVRAVSHSLVPPTLGDLGLVESVQELAATVALVQKLQVDFNAAGFSETDLPENGKLMLYRIIQEALNNIIKHAGASAVQIHLARNNQTILLQVSDNGRGFEPGSVRYGLGLNNIRNRAELFGGKVTINAAPGAGCTLKVVIPKMEN